MQTQTERAMVCLSKELKAKVKQAAQEDYVTLSHFVRIAVRFYLAHREGKSE